MIMSQRILLNLQSTVVDASTHQNLTRYSSADYATEREKLLDVVVTRQIASRDLPDAVRSHFEARGRTGPIDKEFRPTTLKQEDQCSNLELDVQVHVEQDVALDFQARSVGRPEDPDRHSGTTCSTYY